MSAPYPTSRSCRVPDSSSTAGHNRDTTHGCADDRGVVRTANTRRQHELEHRL